MACLPPLTTQNTTSLGFRVFYPFCAPYQGGSAHPAWRWVLGLSLALACSGVGPILFADPVVQGIPLTVGSPVGSCALACRWVSGLSLALACSGVGPIFFADPVAKGDPLTVVSPVGSFASASFVWRGSARGGKGPPRLVQ